MDKSKVLLDLGIIGWFTYAEDLYNPVHIRYTVVLDHDIDDELIVKAWDKTKKVYPIIDAVVEADCGDADFYRNLKQEEKEKHLCDHVYLVRADSGVNNPVRTETPVCPGTDVVGKRAICISYYGRKVSINAFHTLVDGGGMNMVFNTFLYFYLALYTGHEDENPVVELTEGRDLKEYYTIVSPEYVYAADYTPAPIYTLPYNCIGFYDKDMVNDGNNICAGSIAVSFADFLKFCKENGAAPSSMICTLLAKAAYALNPAVTDDIVFVLTASMRKALGLEKSIANAVGFVHTYTTYREIADKTIAEIAQKIRKDVDSQRTKDYYISYYRMLFTYNPAASFNDRTVTYVGSLNVGDNNKHIVDFTLETNGFSCLYMMQLNDKFIIDLQYGMATEKYMNEFIKIFSELGIQAEISQPMHRILNDSEGIIS